MSQEVDEGESKRTFYSPMDKVDEKDLNDFLAKNSVVLPPLKTNWYFIIYLIYLFFISIYL